MLCHCASQFLLLWQNSNIGAESVYLRPATPRTTRLSLVSVPVLSKQQISTFPANGILKGSVQNTSEE